MDKFKYYTPTKVLFGENQIENLGSELLSRKVNKVLIHYGNKSAEELGIITKVKEILEENNISYVTLKGVVPNPRLALVYEGIELSKKENVDFILAIGGGSVVDSSKAIAYGVKNDFDVKDLYLGEKVAEDTLPVGVILTMAAAGSEMSDSSVITIENDNLKRGYSNDICRPVFAIMDPRYTVNVSLKATMAGICDIMMHTMERYFSTKDTTMLTDAISESLLKTVMKCAKILKDDPTNLDARSEIMWASSLSHNGLTEAGRKKDFAVHKMEHELSGMFDVTHGEGLSALWTSWACYVFESDVKRFVKFARNVMDVHIESSDEMIALAGIRKMETFFKELSLPISIKELGINLTSSEIVEMANKCTNNNTKTIGTFKKLTKEDIINIYNFAK